MYVLYASYRLLAKGYDSDSVFRHYDSVIYLRWGRVSSDCIGMSSSPSSWALDVLVHIVRIRMYVWYVCMYVCMVCMYVYMYVCNIL